MTRAVLALLCFGWLTASALAAPAGDDPRQRVVLADPDPELRHAMQQALAPWRLQVVVDGTPPGDAAVAHERAEADTARFVVWRDGAELVVYDRELGATEKRTSRSGPLDPPTAAVAALTIKTMMRLPPPPPPEDTPEPATSPAAAVPSPRIEVRIHAGLATRIAASDATEVTARIGGGAAIQPWPASRWRLGIAGDAGTSTEVSRAGFKGTWSEWSLLAMVGWTYARAAWEFEPHVGGGVRRSSLDGVEMSAARSETATLATARGGLAVRWRLARWTLGVTCDVDRTFGTPTYSKVDTPARIFQVPGTAVELGGVLAIDL